MDEKRRPLLSLKTKHFLALLLTFLMGIGVNLWTSALDAKKYQAVAWVGGVLVVLFAGQVWLLVFTTTIEEERLALLQEAQDVKFRVAIREAEVLHEQIVEAIKKRDHPRVIALEELRARLRR
jgi:hypothetical protein